MGGGGGVTQFRFFWWFPCPVIFSPILLRPPLAPSVLVFIRYGRCRFIDYFHQNDWKNPTTFQFISLWYGLYSPWIYKISAFKTRPIDIFVRTYLPNGNICRQQGNIYNRGHAKTKVYKNKGNFWPMPLRSMKHSTGGD